MPPFLLAQAAEHAGHQPITGAGWLFMALSVGFVTILVAWCYKKVLSLPPEEQASVRDLHSA